MIEPQNAEPAGVTVRESRARSGGPPATRYRVVDADALSQAELARWLELRSANPSLDSPYFHPGFVRAVAAGRPGVRVIVGADRFGTIESLLPVQLAGGACRPAGFPGADFQGPICEPGVDYDIRAAMDAAGASSYEFDHLIESAPGFEPWTFGSQESPYLDVTGGIDGYLQRASRSGKDKVAEARRLGRKAERDHGPVRLEVDSVSLELLDAVIALKRRQYADTGARDHFAEPGHVELLRRLLAERDPDFGGLLSAVYSGPHLLAAHFGLRAGPVLHWWFPAYDPQFSRLSPGWILLAQMIDASPGLGLERIDLGRGMDDYKRRAMTGHQVVCQGAVIRNPLRRQAAAARRGAIAAIKGSPAAPALRRAVHYARRRSS
ncbi:MAG TPA: GNAT family N-acetyltransferase [Solirubrobacteraceae bacterium]